MALAAAMWLLLCAVRPACGADELMIHQTPHDLLTLKEDGQQFQIMPLELKPRAPLQNPGGDQWLFVRLLSRPDQQYQVHWRDISQVTLFEELVLQEAARLTREKDFDTAHLCYQYLDRHAATFPGLNEARAGTLVAEANDWLSQSQYADALGVLNELYRRDRQLPELSGLCGRVVDRLVEEHIGAAHFDAAHVLLDDLAAKFPGHSVVANRRAQLQQLSEAACVEAQRAADGEQWLSAYEHVRRARSMWPDSAAVHALQELLYRKYPLVRVGVRESWRPAATEPSAQSDITTIPSWETQRCQALVEMALYAPLGGSAGEVLYRSVLVDEQSKGADVTYVLRPDARWPDTGQTLTAADLLGPITNRFGRASTGVNPWRWAVEQLQVVDSQSLRLTWIAPAELRRPLLSHFAGRRK